MKNLKQNFHYFNSIVFIIGLIFSSVKLEAQLVGTPDVSFGANGIVLDDVLGNEYNDIGNDAIILDDGKIIIAGGTGTGSNDDAFLMRLKPDGSRDSSFGFNGIIQLDLSLGGNDVATGIKKVNDTTIIVAGYTQSGSNPYNMFLIKMDWEGNMDMSFGASGVKILDSGYDDRSFSLEITSDEKIIIGGTSNNNNIISLFFVKLDSNGNLDNTFGSGGVRMVVPISGSYGFGDITLDNNNNIYFAGWREDVAQDYATVIKLTANGNIDNGFATSGYFETSYMGGGNDTRFWDITIDDSGDLYAGGHFILITSEISYVVKLTPSGNVVTNFGTNGEFSWSENEGSDYFSCQQIITTPYGILMGGEIGNNYYSLMINSDGSFSLNYPPVYNDANASFTAILKKMIVMDDNRVLFIGASIPFSVDMGLLAVFIREPEYVGLNSHEKNPISLYPNPAINTIYFEIPSGEKIETVMLYNINGQIILSSVLNTNHLVLPVDIKNGVYNLKIVMNQSESYHRIIINR